MLGVRCCAPIHSIPPAATLSRYWFHNNSYANRIPSLQQGKMSALAATERLAYPVSWAVRGIAGPRCGRRTGQDASPRRADTRTRIAFVVRRDGAEIDRNGAHIRFTRVVSARDGLDPGGPVTKSLGAEHIERQFWGRTSEKLARDEGKERALCPVQRRRDLAPTR